MKQIDIFKTLSLKVQEEIINCGVYFVDIMTTNNITFEELEAMVEARNIAKGNPQ